MGKYRPGLFLILSIAQKRWYLCAFASFGDRLGSYWFPRVLHFSSESALPLGEYCGRQCQAQTPSHVSSCLGRSHSIFCQSFLALSQALSISPALPAQVIYVLPALPLSLQHPSKLHPWRLCRNYPNAQVTGAAEVPVCSRQDSGPTVSAAAS